MAGERTQRDRASDWDLIGEALRILDGNRRRAMPLAELAGALGLSPYHFQRLFTRWAGISPKRFARYLQLNDARTLLRDARSVLDATHDTGLSSPGRLHDLFVSIDAVTPGEFKSGGDGLIIRTGEHASPFGPCLIGVTDRGLCWLSFAAERNGREELRAMWPAATIREDRSGTKTVFDKIWSDNRGKDPLRLLVGGTNFQVKVWEALIRIPPGALATYGDIGKAIGQPTAARAVGNAVGANAISYLIPCHRVIRSMGVVGDYRWGSEKKRALIAWEALRFAQPAEQETVA